MKQLEIEMRLYLTREPGAKRECIIARNIPHAMQVWQDSADAYSRNLEMVISGEWLQKMIEQSNLQDGCNDVDEISRAEILGICLKGLRSGDAQAKQQCLEEVMHTLGYDVEVSEED